MPHAAIAFYFRSAKSFHDASKWLRTPDQLRRTLREHLPSQIGLCAILGFLVGSLVLLLHMLVSAAHIWAFDLPYDAHLSSAIGLNAERIIIVPVIGGALLALFNLLSKTWKAREIIDPIEANAIYGGRMSAFASLRLITAAFLSNAAGASIGMEAAYTQMGAAFFSRVGQYLSLRREDMRIFVAAGSAAAIAAAFNAPLAGAFYGFELVLGVYTVSAISQVAAAALTGTLLIRIITHEEPIFALPLDHLVIPYWQYGLFIVMGVGAALLGIATMQAVTKCEQFTKKMPLPEWIFPVLGGALVGIIALACPQILGSGQGAINDHLHGTWPLIALTVLLAAKIIGSALSIGFGFRGGLFSSSLFIGCLFGQAVATWFGAFLDLPPEQTACFILVGMGSVAASIVGAPVTIVLLVLEMTGNFAATTGVLLGVLVSSAITRHYFGYSFSTWRFHLRGLRITGAHDVGWINELTVRELMSTDGKVISGTLPVSEVRTILPAGSTKRIFVVDDSGQYRGMIDAPKLHATATDDATKTAVDFIHAKDYFLHPEQDIQQALHQFAEWRQEELPVLSQSKRQILGYLSEAYALRRYATSLEQQNLAQFGTASPKL